MRNKNATLASLKDSRLLYEKKLPAFGYIIVALVAVLLFGVLIWSLITTRTYIVAGSGVIEGANKTYIMPEYSGSIYDLKINNGDIVVAGDELFSIKSTEFDLQAIQLDTKIEICNEQVKQYKKLEKSVIDDTNLFDAAKAEDGQYYNQFEVYKSQIAQNQIDTSTYTSYGYTDEQVKAEIAKNQAKVSEIYHSTLKTIGESINNISAEKEALESQKLAVAEGQSEYKVTAAVGGTVYLTTEYREGMVVQAGNAIGSIAQENSDYYVTALISANDIARTKSGDSVDIAVAGLLESTYGTITGKLIHVDSDITKEQTTSQDGSTADAGSYFKVKIKPDADYLISSSGRKFNLSNGTAVTVRIKYDEVSYFGYLMESLGVLVR